MPKPLSGSEAVALCRTHKPSLDEIRAIIQWAEAGPAPDKLAPVLVLFTRHYASSQYEVLNALYDAMAGCAAVDATPLLECVNGDYDTGRVSAACQVLYRIGVETSCSTCHLEQTEPAAYESRRSTWPAERDQRRALDWAPGTPSPDKIPYLLILQTENSPLRMVSRSA